MRETQLALQREEDAIMIAKMSAQTRQGTPLPELNGKQPILPGTALPHTPSANGASSYKPLSSVWEGSDGDLLEGMLKFYATIPPEPILDATYNAGRFWKGSKRRVVSMDIDPQHKPMIVGDVSSATPRRQADTRKG